MKLRAAVVGVGPAWESRHLPALRALSERFEVVAFCDPVQHRAEYAARQFKAAVHDGFRGLMRREDVDVVLLLSATFYGALPIYAACDMGKAVYCAAAIDLQDAEAVALRQRVEEAGIAFMAEFPCRLSPATLRLKELLATRLGAPKLLFCNRRRIHPAKQNHNSRCYRDLVELVDWCRYIVESEPTSLLATTHKAMGRRATGHRASEQRASEQGASEQDAAGKRAQGDPAGSAQVSPPEQQESSTRENLFFQYAREAGCTCHLFPTGKATKRTANWEQEQAKIADWIRMLPHPVGVYTPYDFRGQQVLDACIRAGVAVPGQVAVVSIGDDQVICELTTPPMSSVTTNPNRAGYEAAGILNQLMAGEYTEPRYVTIDPIDVHTRQSTDVMAIDDSDIAAALQFIYQHACDGINVSDLLKVVPVSRRKLEFNFKKIVGRTPREEILRVKLDHSKRLLASTDLFFSRVAESAGFSNASHLGEVFRREIGVSPSQYRNQCRGS